jgi:hypothetical protein
MEVSSVQHSSISFVSIMESKVIRYTHKHNGFLKWMKQTLMERSKSMLSGVSL